MVRVLILGGGSMAAMHAAAFRAEPGCSVVAVVEPDAERRAAFALAHGIGEQFADLDQALAWGGFDAAANVTPDAAHHPTTMKLIAAGKHVFCEKPLATSYALAMEMTEAAEGRGLVNMVNLTYRNAPALHRARELVLAGAIGTVRHVDASYLQSWLVSKSWGDWRSETRWLWRLSEAHGSKGVLGDVGVHILDFASYGAGSDIATVAARLKTFHKAEGDRIDEYVLDANDSVVMTAEFSGGALGVVQATRFATGYANDLTLRIFGDAGALEVRTNGRSSSLRICEGADIDAFAWQEIECPPVPTTYQRFVAACMTGVNGDPGFRRAADIQRLIDLCFEQDAAARPAPAEEIRVVPEPTVVIPATPPMAIEAPIIAIAPAAEPAAGLAEQPPSETRH